MTTGFVHTMLEQDQTFEQFAWNCAAAYGGLHRKEVSPSYSEEVQKSEDKLALLRSLSEDGLRKIGADRRHDSLRRLREGQAKDNAERDKMLAMMERVKAWEPPAELRELRDFMLEQLKISMPHGGPEFWSELIFDLERRSDLDVAREMISHEEQYLERMRENLEGERTRVAEHNARLAVLEQAIPRPDR